MADEDYSVVLAPLEDLFGGGSRTKHVILKRRSASLAQSAFSCPVFEKIAPNRDYSYEGLFALVGTDYWKFLDMIALGVRSGDKEIKLRPAEVIATPWSCEYRYDAGGRTVRAQYYLYRTSYGAAGHLDVRIEGSENRPSTIVFEPFFDIRFMYGPSEPGNLDATVSEDVLYVTAGGPAICLSSAGARLEKKGRQVSWKYKLGSGYRCRKGDRLQFKPERRTVSSLYEIEVDGAAARLCFSCGPDRDTARKLHGIPASATGSGEPAWVADVAEADQLRRAIFPDYAASKRDILYRVLGMARFGTMVDSVVFHEAGDFWFRSVWFRDEFEGLIHNYQTLRKISGTDGMKQVLRKAFELQDEHGRIPNRLVPGTGGKADYNSADATLLGFILAGMVVRDTNDGDFAQDAAAAFKKYLQGVRCAGLEANGPPRVRPNGLLSVPSWHSWTDGKRNVDGQALPIRVSEAWERELLSMGAVADLDLQMFFLPEINAQWMRSLEAGWLFSKYVRNFSMADTCKMLYNRALEAYKKVFLNPETGFINNLATTDDFALGPRADPMPGSPGVVAASMLGLDVFTIRELDAIARYAKDRLLRTKWGLPFGIVVKESGTGTYVGDEEYHEEVVWPRDTPYLIRLLQITGDQSTVEGLLEANLKHQMEEGFVFYNHELFSCDHDLLPVKNPVQWWSQWVDPYLDRV
ncbi:hypothetical protein [Methanocella arvoryzae]|uniref:Glycogen debranching enzyme C-terminal domain-containing protein n=1 Tax=Methanocella arvoryzae (strain DSM 22066 / NBRC 105507 / MRE50) TaxID=351160 RepID=Q0W781_METAR|nr:hypothetical protein [Methanocella arvoryzae]CAJ35762.1 hypothetical protein RCIX299 [Methanocella arvoryzae MRE50]